jgi:hypothetical protein
METSNITSQKEVYKSTVDNFWRCTKASFEKYQERSTTVNSVCCSEMLRNQLKPAI